MHVTVKFAKNKNCTLVEDIPPGTYYLGSAAVELPPRLNFRGAETTPSQCVVWDVKNGQRTVPLKKTVVFYYRACDVEIIVQPEKIHDE